MLTQILAWTNGKKTYLFVIAWMIYKMGVLHGWWAQYPTLETLLLSGAGLSLRDAIAKLKV